MTNERLDSEIEAYGTGRKVGGLYESDWILHSGLSVWGSRQGFL